jgi:hypothetical protein
MPACFTLTHESLALLTLGLKLDGYDRVDIQGLNFPPLAQRHAMEYSTIVDVYLPL